MNLILHLSIGLIDLLSIIGFVFISKSICWLGPYISASKMPTELCFDKLNAIEAVTELLPTPPLAEPNAIIF